MNNKLILVLMMMFLVSVVSAIPQTFNLHGKVTDSGGSALSGATVMNFSIYDSYTGGSRLWNSGNQTVIVDSDGIYSIILTAIDLNFSEQYYLGVEVGSDAEMTPRINLTSSPYSFRTNVSDYLEATSNYYAKNLNVTTDVCITGGVCLSTVSSAAGGWTDSGTEVGLTTSTDNVSIGSGPTLFVDNSAGRVGIGTASPAYKLDVNGSIGNSVSDLKLQADVQGNVTLFEDTDVDNSSDGGVLIIHRKAEEGDDILKFYVQADGNPLIEADHDLIIKTEWSSLFYRGGGANSNFRITPDGDNKNISFAMSNMGTNYKAIGNYSLELRCSADTDEGIIAIADP